MKRICNYQWPLTLDAQVRNGSQLLYNERHQQVEPEMSCPKLMLTLS